MKSMSEIHIPMPTLGSAHPLVKVLGGAKAARRALVELVEALVVDGVLGANPDAAVHALGVVRLLSSRASAEWKRLLDGASPLEGAALLAVGGKAHEVALKVAKLGALAEWIEKAQLADEVLAEVIEEEASAPPAASTAWGPKLKDGEAPL